LIEPYKYDDYYHWGIEYENKIVGRIKVTEISQGDNFAELAYDIASEVRNRGLMTEAVRAAAKFLFEEVNLNRIYVYILANNYASNRVAQKVGMKLEGVLRKHCLQSDGVYVDVNIYGLLKEEYI
jgi:Acetyltransferases, including N-acetylases of ribosomal proteins